MRHALTLLGIFVLALASVLAFAFGMGQDQPHIAAWGLAGLASLYVILELHDWNL